MAYVDLNPIGSSMADTPEASEFTSVKDRIEQISSHSITAQPNHLHPFVGDERQDMPAGIPFKLKDYLELIGGSFASMQPLQPLHPCTSLDWPFNQGK